MLGFLGEFLAANRHRNRCHCVIGGVGALACWSPFTSSLAPPTANRQLELECVSSPTRVQDHHRLNQPRELIRNNVPVSAILEVPWSLPYRLSGLTGAVQPNVVGPSHAVSDHRQGAEIKIPRSSAIPGAGNAC
jgi:hypothetical protein